MYSYLQVGHGRELHSKVQEAPAHAGLHSSQRGEYYPITYASFIIFTGQNSISDFNSMAVLKLINLRPL